MKILMENAKHVLSVGLVVFLLAGCAAKPEPEKPRGQLDNVWHHYTQGMTALEKNKGDAAMRKFNRALQLQDAFSAALAGKSLAMAMRATRSDGEGYRKTDTEEALGLLDQAGKAADSARESFVYHVTAIRVYAMTKPDGWLGEAQDHHQSANALEVNEADLPYYQQRDAADYFMAVAWFREDFRQTEPLLKKVLAARSTGKWQGQAADLYKRVQKISLAAAHHTLSHVALKVAVLDEVGRGDVAALLVTELKLDTLFAGRIPVRSQEDKRKAVFTPADILEHPFRDEIMTIMKWNVRGLVPEYDATTQANLFKPQQAVDRKGLALILEEVIIKLLPGQEHIATENIGQRSAFPDVPATVGWFNAIMTVTTRGLMASTLSGEFRPNDPVTGAELLLAVFKLRGVMNIP